MLVIEDPDAEVLDLLAVEELPTWLLLRSAPGAAAQHSPPSTEPAEEHHSGDVLGDLAGAGLRRADGALGDMAFPPGSCWEVAERRVGALPKHEVDVLLRDAAGGGPTATS